MKTLHLISQIIILIGLTVGMHTILGSSNDHSLIIGIGGALLFAINTKDDLIKFNN